MSGIDRLRTLAGEWDEWGLGGTLAEMADQIERERACDEDAIENIRLIVGGVIDDMERHVSGHEGADDSHVARWARELRSLRDWRDNAEPVYPMTVLLRRCREFGVDTSDCEDGEDVLNNLIETLRKRSMPEGMEWPRYESGEPVGFGDEVSRLGEVFSISLYCDGSFALNFRAYSRGERVRRPAVIAADGEPLEVGQTVWDTDDETDTPLTVVEVSSDLVRCEYTWKDGKTYRPCYPPDQLTHQRPDTWQRVEEDAGCTATKYNERRGTIFTTKQQVARDLVRRCRALAERERGE